MFHSIEPVFHSIEPYAMKKKVSAKEVADMLLRFTVSEPPHRQVIMSNVSYLDEAQKAKVRDEIMFLDLAVLGGLLQSERVKQYWPTSEIVLVGYLTGLKETLGIIGGGFDGLSALWRHAKQRTTQSFRSP